MTNLAEVDLICQADREGWNLSTCWKLVAKEYWQKGDCAKFSNKHKTVINPLQMKSYSKELRDAFLCAFCILSLRAPRVSVTYEYASQLLHLIAMNWPDTGFKPSGQVFVYFVEQVAGLIKLAILTAENKRALITSQPTSTRLQMVNTQHPERPTKMWHIMVMRMITHGCLNQ
eukprot:g9702.t1